MEDWLKIVKDMRVLPAVVALSRKQLFFWINSQVPFGKRIAWSTFSYYANDPDSKLNEFLARIEAESIMDLYDQLQESDSKEYRKYLEILERRFKETWGKTQFVESKNEHTMKEINITFKEVNTQCNSPQEI